MLIRANKHIDGGVHNCVHDRVHCDLDDGVCCNTCRYERGIMGDICARLNWNGNLKCLLIGGGLPFLIFYESGRK